MKQVFDKAVNKFISRKFMVWLTATGVLLQGNLSSSDWVIVSTVFIGGQTVVDVVARLRK